MIAEDWKKAKWPMIDEGRRKILLNFGGLQSTN